MFNLPPEAPFGGKPSWTRHIIVTIFGEFCGTFLFLFLSFAGAQTALDTNDPLDPEAPLLPYSLMYISASFGVSLALTVWVFFRVTGGMFNPAVSICRTVPNPWNNLVLNGQGYLGTDTS